MSGSGSSSPLTVVQMLPALECGGVERGTLEVAAELVRRLQHKPLAADSIINVNIPDLPYAALKGYRVTRLGHRHKSEPVVKAVDPRGRTIYWVGPAGAEQDAGPETDFYAVREGYVSLTPLQVDLTRHDARDSLAAWVEGVVR